jgi:hypothetical protein
MLLEIVLAIVFSAIACGGAALFLIYSEIKHRK